MEVARDLPSGAPDYANSRAILYLESIGNYVGTEGSCPQGNGIHGTHWINSSTLKGFLLGFGVLLPMGR